LTAQFPTNIVSTGNIPDANPLTTLSANNHAGKHNDLRDEIIAIETKVGITNSLVNTTLDYKTKNITGGDQAIGASQTVSVSNKTLVSPKVTVGSDAIGDTLYNSSGATGVQSRLAVGTTGQVLTSNGTLPYWSSPSGANVNYIVDSGAANAYVANLSPALGAYTTGVLVQFKATNANTTASTVNVNGLGAKTIKKLGGATDLVSGDIASGMIVELEYDGTNFVMLNPVANAPVTLTAGVYPTGSAANLTNIPLLFANGTTTYDLSTATGTQNIAHGLAVTPKYIRITYYSDSVSATPWVTWGSGTYNGTTNSTTGMIASEAMIFQSGFANSAQIISITTNNAGGIQTATATFNSTNIVLSWTKTSSPAGTAYLMWEAFA